MSYTNRSASAFPEFLGPMQGETLITVTHPSAMNFIWLIVLGVCLIPVLIGVLILLCVGVNIMTTSYVVTNKRVVSKKGLLRITQSEVRIDDIRGVNMKRGLWQRIIGTGDITIGTAATGGAEIVMYGIGRPRHIVDAINSQRTM